MLHLLLFYPSTWYICDFFLFHIEIEGKGGWIIGRGGGERVGGGKGGAKFQVGTWRRNDVDAT